MGIQSSNGKLFEIIASSQLKTNPWSYIADYFSTMSASDPLAQIERMLYLSSETVERNEFEEPLHLLDPTAFLVEDIVDVHDSGFIPNFKISKWKLPLPANYNESIESFSFDLTFWKYEMFRAGYGSRPGQEDLV